MRARPIALGALGLAALAVVALILGAGGREHRITAVFDSATNIREGLSVRAAGLAVGEVTGREVDRGRARLELTITEDAAWPLPRDSKAQVRWGGTVAFSDRYIELIPGSEDAPDLADGGLIAVEDTLTPVEVDKVLRTFDRRGRDDLGATIDRSGATLGQSGEEIGRVLDRTPSALQRTRGLLAELGDDPEALDTLIRSTDSVVNAVNTADPGVEEVLSGMGATFDAMADESVALRESLDEMPAALAALRGTLGRADGTLVRARDLTRDLGPGIREVRGITPQANTLLRRLTRVGPLAEGTLASLRKASPDLVRLLDRARPLLPKLESIGRQAATQLYCIRPYGPEIAGFPSTWGGFLINGDEADKYARVAANGLPLPHDSPLTSKQITDAVPGLAYAFPRPPGQNVGKPWFIEECGVGPDSVDPAKDPETIP